MPDLLNDIQSQITSVYPQRAPIVPYPQVAISPNNLHGGDHNWKILFIISTVICICMIIVTLSLLLKPYIKFSNKKTLVPSFTIVPITTAPVTISGTINFDGYAPTNSYLVITERSSEGTDYKNIVTDLIPGKDTNWFWTDAKHGSNYEIRAELKVLGQTVQSSVPVNISAPATKVNLRLVSEQQPPQPQSVTVNGNIHLDGYIPPNSTLTILARDSGQGDFTTVISGLTAQDNISWSWDKALTGKTYDIEAQLTNSAGIQISSSSPKAITAPSSGLVLVVSSTVQPPTPVVTGISGTITINGDILPNGHITLGVRKTGSTTFSEVANNISAINGVSWSWNNVQSGTEYDVQAYLWTDNNAYASSDILTVTAPSVNNVLTLNAQQALAAPSGDTLNVSCEWEQNNAFQVTINYNTNNALQNVVAYNVIATLGSQGNQVLNTTLTPANPNQLQSLGTTYIFTSGVTYYAQYAYSTTLSPTTFSGLSPGVQFSCR